MVNLQEAFKQLVEKQEKEAALKHRDAQIEQMITVNSAVFDKAIAYVNVIMLSGYAGAFALLGMTKDLLNPKILVISALLLTFSLMVFCAWELTKMIINGRIFMRLVPLVKDSKAPEEFFKNLKDYQLLADRLSLYISRWWIAVLVMSVLPGFLAGLLLLINYVLILVN